MKDVFTILTADGYMVEHLFCDLATARRELADYNEHDPETGYVLDSDADGSSIESFLGGDVFDE